MTEQADAPPIVATVIVVLDAAHNMQIQRQGDAETSAVVAVGMLNAAATVIISPPHVHEKPKLEVVRSMPSNGV